MARRAYVITEERHLAVEEESELLNCFRELAARPRLDLHDPGRPGAPRPNLRRELRKRFR